jgi:hypothetical protein
MFKQHVLSSNLKKISIILKVDWGNSLCVCVGLQIQNDSSAPS